MSRQFSNEAILDLIVDYLRDHPNSGFLEAHEAAKLKLIEEIVNPPQGGGGGRSGGTARSIVGENADDANSLAPRRACLKERATVPGSDPFDAGVPTPLVVKLNREARARPASDLLHQIYKEIWGEEIVHEPLNPSNGRDRVSLGGRK